LAVTGVTCLTKVVTFAERILIVSLLIDLVAGCQQLVAHLEQLHDSFPDLLHCYLLYLDMTVLD
jgi:hypothetical protein